ncbi:MAG: tRNA-guanine transglycosylase [Anaerolineae bacterium]|nr:tRNA-guanine transglycosylase [Anaerolineae bacterium]
MTKAVKSKPSFTTNKATTNGRLGSFSFNHPIRPIQTPFLFPVAFLMTGTTARGGATWKYILQAQDDKTIEHTLLRRNSPVLSQVLHFLDYRLSPNSLQTWRRESIRRLYNKQVENLNYQAPIFLDSGGFTLMWRAGLDLSRYDISLDPGQEARSILQLQRDLGGDIVATLDYPLPPNLQPSEVSQRTRRSLENAVQAAKLLRNDTEFKDYDPFLYMAVHGLTPETMANYVQELFKKIEEEKIGESGFGLAIGSLVPMRKDPKKIGQVINIIKAAVTAIPETYKDRVPVHIFGATGLLVPFLAYIGIDTFDSSTFAQEARSLQYILPHTFQRRNVMEMSSRDIASCKCPICQNMNLQELQSSLASETVGKKQASGHYKSKYYADIALHNLELDLDVLKQTREAIKEDNLDEYLLKIAKDVPRLQTTLEILTMNDQQLKRKASRFIQPASQKQTIIREVPVRYVSLSHTPDDFNINDNGYNPSRKKPVLLIIPCSREKPYSHSHSHKHLFAQLEKSIPDWENQIDKVTLSGLYGPVPFACESAPAIMEYDFRLITSNRQQIELCAERLVTFLRRHESFYEHCIAYGTSNAYRLVFEQVARQYSQLEILPHKPKSRTLQEFFRAQNVMELIEFLQTVLAQQS